MGTAGGMSYSLFFVVLQEIFNACKCLGYLVDGCCIGAAYVVFTAFAEGIARHQGDMLGHEQLLCEFFTGVAGGGNIREDVEGAFRLKAFQTELGEAVVNQGAAAVILRDHFFHVFFAAEMPSPPSK